MSRKKSARKSSSPQSIPKAKRPDKPSDPKVSVPKPAPTLDQNEDKMAAAVVLFVVQTLNNACNLLNRVRMELPRERWEAMIIEAAKQTDAYPGELEDVVDHIFGKLYNYEDPEPPYESVMWPETRGKKP